jgi:hypothetical protein
VSMVSAASLGALVQFWFAARYRRHRSASSIRLKVSLEPSLLNGRVFTSASAMVWSENSQKCRNRAFDRPLVRVEPAVRTVAGNRTGFRQVGKQAGHGAVPLVPGVGTGPPGAMGNVAFGITIIRWAELVSTRSKMLMPRSGTRTPTVRPQT